jgi:hypothetical protein
LWRKGHAGEVDLDLYPDGFLGDLRGGERKPRLEEPLQLIVSDAPLSCRDPPTRLRFPVEQRLFTVRLGSNTHDIDIAANCCGAAARTSWFCTMNLRSRSWRSSARICPSRAATTSRSRSILTRCLRLDRIEKHDKLNHCVLATRNRTLAAPNPDVHENSGRQSPAHSLTCRSPAKRRKFTSDVAGSRRAGGSRSTGARAKRVSASSRCIPNSSCRGRSRWRTVENGSLPPQPSPRRKLRARNNPLRDGERFYLSSSAPRP